MRCGVTYPLGLDPSVCRGTQRTQRWDRGRGPGHLFRVQASKPGFPFWTGWTAPVMCRAVERGQQRSPDPEAMVNMTSIGDQTVQLRRK